MAWVKLDDGFAAHPKLLGLSDRAFRVHVAALCWCSAQLTDGHVPRAALPILGGTGKAAAELAAAGVWDETDGGWVVHDYLEFQPSRAEYEAQQESKSDRGAKGNHKRWHEARGIVDPDCRYCDPPSDRYSDPPGMEQGLRKESPRPVPSPTTHSTSSSTSTAEATRHSDDDGFGDWVLSAAGEYARRKYQQQTAEGFTIGDLESWSNTVGSRWAALNNAALRRLWGGPVDLTAAEVVDHLEMLDRPGTPGTPPPIFDPCPDCGFRGVLRGSDIPCPVCTVERAAS